MFILYVRFGQTVVSHVLVRCGYYVAFGWVSKAHVDESAGLPSPDRQLAGVAFAASVFDQQKGFGYVGLYFSFEAAEDKKRRQVSRRDSPTGLGGVLHREGGRYVSRKAFLVRFFVLCTKVFATGCPPTVSHSQLCVIG